MEWIENNARIAPLFIFSIFGLYLLVLFVPSHVILRDKPHLSGSELARQSPKYRWINWFHPLYSWVTILLSLGMTIMFVSISALGSQANLVTSFAIWMIGINTFNGLFELLTSVSPAYGVILKRHSSQQFICDSDVKKLGWIRILLSLIAAILLVWVIHANT